jgi:ATP-binding cassette, subfamily C, bacterial
MILKTPEPLRSALASCGAHLGIAAVLSALVNILYLTPTLYMLQAYDRVLPTGGLVTLLWISILALLAFAVLGVLSDLRSRVMVRASLRLERELGQEIMARTLAAATTSETTRQRAFRDFDSFRQMVTGQGVAAIMDAPWTPIYILAATLLHPLIGVLTVVGCAILIVLAILNERAGRVLLEKSAEAMAQAQFALEAVQRNADTVRALGMQTALGKVHLGRRAEGIEGQALASLQVSAYSNGIKAMRLVLQSAVLGLAVWLAVEQQVTAGAIIAASLLMGRALAPVDQMVGAWSGITQGMAAIRRLVGLFRDNPQHLVSLQLPPPAGRLRVQNVTVAIPPDRVLVSNASFELVEGELLGVIGPSGSGKTTLLAAIAGARALHSGLVRIDGANMTDWDSERLAVHIGYLPQDSVLFAGSVRDNIARFGSNTDTAPEDIDAAVIDASRRAGAHELVLGLPGGYGLQLGNGGQRLSAGQAQRVALARALYGQPSLLILDEPNSHLDGDGELALIASLRNEKARGAAIVMAAHRTNMLAVADKLLVMRSGRVEMFGPTTEVLGRLRAMGQAESKGADL